MSNPNEDEEREPEVESGRFLVVGGSILDFSASFNVVGEDLDPAEVSELLGLTPTNSHRRGDPHYGSSGRRYADHRGGLWAFKSPLERDQPLEAHLDYLLSHLQGKQGQIGILRSRGYQVQFFIGVFEIGCADELFLSAEQMSAAAILQVDVRFDLYPY